MSWTQGSSFPPNIVPFLSPDDLVPTIHAAGTVIGGAAGSAMQVVGDLTAAQLNALMPAARVASVSKYLGPINTAFRRYGILRAEQRAAILGRLALSVDS